MPSDPTSEHREPSREDDDLEAILPLVSIYLERIPEERRQAAEDISAAHPELAAPFRDYVESLQRMGLIGASRDDSPAPSFAELGKDPESFGGFRLVRRLGRGGMGVVYLAHQRSLDRPVALKVIRRELLRFPGARARFEREARVLSRLDHRGICPVYEVGEVIGTPYIAMAFIDGETLAERLARVRKAGPVAGSSRGASRATRSASTGPSSRDEIVAVTRLVEKAALAVHAAHEAGLIHRDVKPANIMIKESGDPVVLDFGLARPEAADEQSLTATGERLGTPAYMAPEQIAPEGLQLDRRCDVYGLGVTLYECLTFRTPFEGSTREDLYRQILTGDYRVASGLNRQVSRDLDTVLQTALERDRNRRYASALALAEDLRRVRRFEPIRARRAGPILRLRRWAQRNPVGAAFLVVLSLGLLVTAWMLSEARAARARAEQTRERVDYNLLTGLQAEAEKLWPARRAMLPELEAWRDRAKPLADRLEPYKTELEALRRRGTEYTAATGGPEGKSHPWAVELAALEAKREEVSARLAALGEENAEPAKGVEAENGKKESAPVRDCRKELEGHDREIVELEKLAATWSAWEFEDPEDATRHAELSRLVAALEAFTGDDPRTGTVARVKRRIEVARTIRQKTLDDHREAWNRTVAAIRESPKYGGLEIQRQLGLIPIGFDPASGLAEFAHWESGATPERDLETGKLRLTEKTGVVLVLVPGGTFHMGASPAEDAVNRDPQATSLEGPVHEVTLDPFLISKYEMTQGQWLRLTGHNPSHWCPGFPVKKIEVTLLHPVERISCQDCRRVLPRHGLSVPSEAQWEYAARAGTTTVFWTGDRPSSLRGAEHLRGVPIPPGLKDEGVGHMRVGALRPNPFGLHDVLGNLAEWTADLFGRYPGQKDPRTGKAREMHHVHSYRRTHLDRRMVRGAIFRHPPFLARSSNRGFQLHTGTNRFIGVRPVWMLE